MMPDQPQGNDAIARHRRPGPDNRGHGRTPQAQSPTASAMSQPGQEMLRAALAMAARGWFVFPCAAGGKEPALRGSWQEHATTDPLQVRDWWTRRPYNIGISCGPSGLVVIDLDMPKAAGQPNGLQSFARLCQQHGQPLPWHTFAAATPSGGLHLYYAARGHDIRNSAGKLAPLVDVRAAGGYVIAPGSRIGDHAYTEHNPARPAPLPGWLATMLAQQPQPPVPRPRAIPNLGASATAYATAALRDEVQRVANAVDGTRHDTLNKAAYNLGQLVGAGLLPERPVITSLANAAAQSGLAKQPEILRIIGSGMNAGIRHPRAMPTTPPRKPNAPAGPQSPRDGPAVPGQTATPRLAP
jgi:hypothetical protein